MNGVVRGCVVAWVRGQFSYVKRSGANGFQTGKEMSSFLLDKPSVGDTIEIRQLSTGVTVTGVKHSKD